jgi:hypothetical protein
MSRKDRDTMVDVEPAGLPLKLGRWFVFGGLTGFCATLLFAHKAPRAVRRVLAAIARRIPLGSLG